MKAFVLLWFSLQTTIFPVAVTLEEMPSNPTTEYVAVVLTPVYIPLMVATAANPNLEFWVNAEFAAWEEIVEASFGQEEPVMRVHGGVL